MVAPDDESKTADGRTAGGTYTLVLVRDAAGTVTVGALGEVHLPAGAYAYVGSALGTGGFARVDRHRRVARGEHDTRHWHVDYLAGDPSTRLADVVTTAGVDAECVVADGITERLAAGSDCGPGSVPVPRFGASDCDCRSHLFGHEAVKRLDAVVRAAHRSVRR